MLLINLLAAHIYRFQLSVKKLGIQLAHSGVILLLVGQLATDMFAHESQMQFFAGETKSWSESAQNYELIFETPAGANAKRVVSIPASLLAGGGVIRNANLPFAVRAVQYWKNSGEPMFRAPMMQHDPPIAKNGVALNFDFQPAPEVKATDEKNIPAAVIELSRQGETVGNWIVSDWSSDEELIQAVREDSAQMLNTKSSDPMVKTIVDDLTQPQTVDVDGKHFTFYLRPQQTHFPFSLTLLKATHTVYEGSDIPKDFRSRVQLKNPQTGENRQVEISMNSPLRYDGLTFYQYQMTAGEMAQQAGQVPSSVLQVVHNPSWLTPYIGCGMVGAGLAIQFMFHLVGFIVRRK
jgi:cytochrome c biogenesis protein ResB